MNRLLAFILVFLSMALTNVYGQYPFEKYPKIKYKEFSEWTDVDATSESPDKIIVIEDFFSVGNHLRIQLTTYSSYYDSSFVSIYKDNELLQRVFEPMGFFHVVEPARMADINGDGKRDVKIIIPYGGNGTASMNVRVIYLFQKTNQTFDKLSFMDKMGGENREERDFNGDKNYEIITMALQGYKDHNYWTFNIYNYRNGTLENVNSKYDYPIMIQFLFRDNYKITDKVGRTAMKRFSKALPEDFDKR